MAKEATYEHESLQSIKVFYPKNAAPFVPQSCYSFGSKQRVRLCCSVNRAMLSTFNALFDGGLDSQSAASKTREYAESMLLDIGYAKASTKDFDVEYQS